MDIRNFVNVNIKPSATYNDTGTRPLTLLFTGVEASTDDTSSTTIDTSIINNCVGRYTGKGVTENSFIKDDEDTIINNTDLLPYLQFYFNNGGAELQVIAGSLADQDLKALYTNYPNAIVIAQVGLSVDNDLVKKLDNLNGVYKKILVARTENANVDDLKSSYIALKYSTIAGSEMTIAGYLSQIKVYENVRDYAFTLENGKFDADKDLHNNVNKDKEDGTTEDLKVNVEMQIANNWYNIGGNMTDGESSIAEVFTIIVLQQTLSYAVFNVLTAKISGQTGMGLIRSTIAEELNKYVRSGFLVQDLVWTKPDLVIKNSIDESKGSEVVITKNTPITSGYVIHIFKLSTSRRSVYVYIVLATARGIRYVQIDGEYLR